MTRLANRPRADAKWRDSLQESLALTLFFVGVATLLAGAIGVALQLFGL